MSNTSAEIDPSVPKSSSRLFGSKNYRSLLLAQIVSDLGDGVYAMGLLWAMKVLTGSGVQLSLVLAAEIIPTIVLGIFAGVLVDLGNKKRYMLIADVSRGVVVSALGALWAMGLLHP